jgi:hypothetical protein
MPIKAVQVGQEVTLGGYPDEWLIVQRAEGERLRVCHRFGPHERSAGFWIDTRAVRQVRSHSVFRGRLTT